MFKNSLSNNSRLIILLRKIFYKLRGKILYIFSFFIRKKYTLKAKQYINDKNNVGKSQKKESNKKS